MADDALSLHIKGMLEDGENIPAPSKLEDIMDDPGYTDAAAILVVSVSEAKPRSVGLNITLIERKSRVLRIQDVQGQSRNNLLSA